MSLAKRSSDQMEVTGSYKDLSILLSELKESPEARRLLSPETLPGAQWKL
jgi:hypothetical protein